MSAEHTYELARSESSSTALDDDAPLRRTAMRPTDGSFADASEARDLGAPTTSEAAIIGKTST
jgi:hypothetical protein